MAKAKKSQAELQSEYNFKPVNPKVKGEEREAVVDRLSRGGAQAFADSTPREREVGSRFFPDWNQDAQYLGARTGGTVANGAAMLAHLSPSTEAELNRLQAYQLLGMSDKSRGHLEKSSWHASQGASLRSKARAATKSGDHSTAAQYLSQAEEHKRASDQHRVASGIVGTPLGMNTSMAAVKAWGAANAPEEHAFDNLGRLKINDFGHAIHDPHGYGRATIDTHYHDALAQRHDLPYEMGRGISSLGGYEIHQEAAQRAHQMSLATDPSTPRDIGSYMAAAWTHEQVVKSKLHGGRTAAESRLRNFQGGQFDPSVTHGQRGITMWSTMGLG